ncbi:MAG: hypothetical protein R6V77_08260 [Candidatus Cloacimonadaceae bacterium]
MKQRFYLLAILLLFVLTAIAQTQDLPDVEVSGPSLLRSFLEKRGLAGTDLIVPDVTDSLNPLFPPFPKDDLVTYKRLRKNALHLNYNSPKNLHAAFLADSLFTLPIALKAGLNLYSPDEDWNSLAFSSGIVYERSAIRQAILVKHLDAWISSSAYDLKYQSVSAINLNYNFIIRNLLKNHLDMQLSVEVQNRLIDYRDDGKDMDATLNFNHAVGFSTPLCPNLNLKADARLAYKTPVFSLGVTLRENDFTDKFAFLRGLSVDLTDQRIMPGIHLSQRFALDSENSFHILQKSALNVYENFGLLSSQPWQEQQSDALVAFKPLDAMLSFTNQNIVLFGHPVMFNLATGVEYIFDQPGYYEPVLQNAFLPKLSSQTVFQNIYRFGLNYGSSAVKLSQFVELNKGWLKERNDAEMPYLPFLTLDSSLELKLDPLHLKGTLNQYYKAKDELGNDLEEALELDADVYLRFGKDITLYLKGQNLLNKGRIIYRTLPGEPVAVFGGLILTF